MTTFGNAAPQASADGLTNDWVAGFSWHVMRWRQDGNGKVEYFTKRAPVDMGRPMTPQELRYALDALDSKVEAN